MNAEAKEFNPSVASQPKKGGRGGRGQNPSDRPQTAAAGRGNGRGGRGRDGLPHGVEPQNTDPASN